MTTLPRFLIIGAQKAGSTFLHETLRQHPSLFLPRYETPIFEDPFYQAGAVQSELGRILAPARPDQKPGIKRPDYLGRPECPARLARHLPDAQLVVTLRHPLARAISAYYWYMQVGILPVRPLNEGMADLLKGNLTRRNPKAQEVLSYGLYHEHLQRYLRYFNAKQMLIILDTELRADVTGVLKRVFTFLGVDVDFTPPDLKRKPKQSVYAQARLRWLAWANQHFFYDSWQDADQMLVLAPKKSNIAQLAYYACLSVDRVVLQRLYANEAPILEPTLAQALRNFYYEDILALQALLCTDLDTWLSM